MLLMAAITSLVFATKYFSNTEEEGIELKSAVVYNSECTDIPAAYSHLEQSLVVNLKVELIDVADYRGFDENGEKDKKLYEYLKEFDILYPDSSIMKYAQSKKLAQDIEEFVRNGGSVFLSNEFWNFFNTDFIGAGEFIKLEGIQGEFKFPEVTEDLKPLQELVEDFTSLYNKYKDKKELAAKDYGYGIKGGTAKPLVVLNETALYTINQVGEGYVYFTNPVLPNEFNINSLDMQPKKEGQKYFSNTTAACNQMIRSAFAAFISKDKYGFSVERTFGCYGRPSIMWQLHYEEQSGIRENSAVIMSELCKKFLEIPSFSIIRNTYYWFTRYETVTYLLADNSDGNDKNYTYAMDERENAYSSGIHIASGNEWFQLGKVENAGSYFKDRPEFCKRAYPCVFKNPNSGYVDLICGADDGYFYYFAGLGFGENYETEKKVILKNRDGNKLSVGEGSAPVLLDIDGDNIEDIISGSASGEVYCFRGLGNWCFDNPEKILDKPFDGQCFPQIGYINEDGIPDLVVGGNSSNVKFYFGQKTNKTLTFVPTKNLYISGMDEIKGSWCAPALVDFNNDKEMDLVIGTVDGYIARFLRNGDRFVFEGYFTGPEDNYKGNNYLKFGNNCVPVFFDLNGDGREDLIVGSIENGLAYPLDSKYFPYKKELQAQLKHMQENYYSVDMHLYTKYYASNAYEKKEIQEHLNTMKSYGLDTTNIGFNMHTWHLSKNGYTQTLDNGFDAGLCWCSGFEPAKSDATPDNSAETALSIPFMYGQKNKLKDRVIFNASLFLYDYYKATDISVKYGLPLSIYYHCEFSYSDKKEAERIVWIVADFTRKNNYNFITEKQFAKMAAASYNTDFLVYMNKENNTINIETKTLSKEGILYDSNYQQAVGVKVVLGEKMAEEAKYTVKSKVLDKRKNVYYLGATCKKMGQLSMVEKYPELQIVRVNIPADINYRRNNVTLEFLDGGMMQAETAGPATTSSQGWTVTKSENGGTIFTKYGKGEALDIHPVK